eukprot:NODE_1291_length_918_cov_109.595449_g1245_i0.p1 GENE.NODE_1291_length_918_cov_109.595449_g1245_i0~~NODE_1291_length_918_cov_109.595449_g1245_i0.p1  ORF type:complete len:246 (-),score=33.33 NODE_1291_length_918_cov_109.595449_g1245_i0:81-818(-)
MGEASQTVHTIGAGPTDAGHNPLATETLVNWAPAERLSDHPAGTFTGDLPGSAGEVRRALNKLFPSVQWNDAGEEFIQAVSSEDLGSNGVLDAQQRLDEQLQVCNARSSGICPVREALFSQCLDELIRQTTIGCVERGELLAELRDELDMRIDGYRYMYDTACQLSHRHTLLLHKTAELKAAREKLQEEADIADRRLVEQRCKLDALEKQENDRKAADEQKHQQEVAFLKKANVQLTTEIRRYMS